MDTNTQVYENIPDNIRDISTDNTLVLNNIDSHQTYNQTYLPSSRETTITKEQEATSDEATTEDSTNTNKETRKLSFFKEVDCGEPMTAQHLRIDFTPTEYDTDELREKCYEFWKFINGRSDLQHLEVYPIKPDISSISSQSVKEPESTSYRALDWIVNDGKMTGAFMSKDKNRHCEQSRSEYHDVGYSGQTTNSVTMEKDACDVKLIPNTKGQRKQVKKLSTMLDIKKKAANKLNKLTKDMEDWDASHPRSMEPPGHVPHFDHEK